MENRGVNRPGLGEDIAVAVAFIAMMSYVIFRAWVAEDAYITFRIIDNFYQGYGLRWNIYERVQAYTHPLWMLLQLAAYGVWRNLFLVSIALSILCTAGALLMTLAARARPLSITLVGFFLPLALSHCFIDYTTAGMENALCFLCFAFFGYVMRNCRGQRYFWLFCALAVSLALLTRLDTLLLYLPALLWLLYTHRGHIGWKQAALGIAPLAAWFGFALLYYGFIFPNTKYAKLNTGFPEALYLQNGIYYARHLLLTDTQSALMLLVAPLLCLYSLYRRKFGLSFFIALGGLSYMLYIIAIGGDYMMGRFWALPVFVSAWLLYTALPAAPRPDLLFALACVLLAAYAVPASLVAIDGLCNQCIVGANSLTDASRKFGGNRLVSNPYPLSLRREGDYLLGERGRKLGAQKAPPVTVLNWIGMMGYYAGPNVRIIDEDALADPLLAQLPVASRDSFYIGHFRRDLPEGYLHAIETGSTEQMDTSLAQYYDKLRIITAGPLWDRQRLKTILAFNLGYYDHWKKDYLLCTPR